MRTLSDALRRKLSVAPTVAPGVIVAVTIAAAATFISEHHGGPTLLYALLIGMAFHFLANDETTGPGIAFAATTVLRVGVALLGARISAQQIVELGFVPVVIVAAGVSSTILVGLALSRQLERSRYLGILTGGAVAICGASAALAISSVLPKKFERESSTLFTIIAVTTLSTVAMITYPLIVHSLGLNDYDAGTLLGATIHDVAQVVGAGHLISPEAEAVATYVKLLRVAMLMPVIVVISVLVVNAEGRPPLGRKPIVPFFLLGFAAFALANSLRVIPLPVADVISDVSRWCLVCAIAALGIKTALQELAKVGWRSMVLVVAETMYLLAFVLCALLVLR